MFYILPTGLDGEPGNWEELGRPCCSFKGCAKRAFWEIMTHVEGTVFETSWRCEYHFGDTWEYKQWACSYWRPSMEELGRRAIPRETLMARGYRQMLKSSDFFEQGYIISTWIHPGRPYSEVIEFNPRPWGYKGKEPRPRLTACCYRQQATIHKALGVPVTGPGQLAASVAPCPLFDNLEATNATV